MLKEKKKRSTQNPEFYTMQKYPSKVKEKYFLKLIVSIPTLKEMLKKVLGQKEKKQSGCKKTVDECQKRNKYF